MFHEKRAQMILFVSCITAKSLFFFPYDTSINSVFVLLYFVKIRFHHLSILLRFSDFWHTNDAHVQLILISLLALVMKQLIYKSVKLFSNTFIWFLSLYYFLMPKYIFCLCHSYFLINRVSHHKDCVTEFRLEYKQAMNINIHVIRLTTVRDRWRHNMLTKLTANAPISLKDEWMFTIANGLKPGFVRIPIILRILVLFWICLSI